MSAETLGDLELLGLDLAGHAMDEAALQGDPPRPLALTIAA